MLKISKAFSLALCGLVLSSAAFADSEDSKLKVEVDSGVELSGGYEYQSIGTTVPKTFDPTAPTRASDNSHSGGRIAIGFQGVKLRFDSKNAKAREVVTFVPLYVVLDASLNGEAGGFGRVADYSGDLNTIRRFIGTLVEATYEPKDEIYSFRAKLARVDYDRDKGTWEWRALDAGVVVTKSWQATDGGVMFDLEVTGGAGFGGTYMKNLADVEAALGIAQPMEHAFTLNPYVAMRTGFRADSWKVELITSAEQRVDLTPKSDQPKYLNNSINVHTQVVSTALEGEWIFAKPRHRSKIEQWSLFGSVGYSYDNLTLSNIFFRTGDAFHSFKVMAGIRGKF